MNLFRLEATLKLYFNRLHKKLKFSSPYGQVFKLAVVYWWPSIWADIFFMDSISLPPFHSCELKQYLYIPSKKKYSIQSLLAFSLHYSQKNSVENSLIFFITVSLMLHARLYVHCSSLPSILKSKGNIEWFSSWFPWENVYIPIAGEIWLNFMHCASPNLLWNLNISCMRNIQSEMEFWKNHIFLMIFE